jgi:hypothetical protein
MVMVAPLPFPPFPLDSSADDGASPVRVPPINSGLCNKEGAADARASRRGKEDNDEEEDGASIDGSAAVTPGAFSLSASSGMAGWLRVVAGVTERQTEQQQSSKQGVRDHSGASVPHFPLDSRVIAPFPSALCVLCVCCVLCVVGAALIANGSKGDPQRTGQNRTAAARGEAGEHTEGERG